MARESKPKLSYLSKTKLLLCKNKVFGNKLAFLAT